MAAIHIRAPIRAPAQQVWQALAATGDAHRRLCGRPDRQPTRERRCARRDVRQWHGRQGAHRQHRARSHANRVWRDREPVRASQRLHAGRGARQRRVRLHLDHRRPAAQRSRVDHPADGAGCARVAGCDGEAAPEVRLQPELFLLLRRDLSPRRCARALPRTASADPARCAGSAPGRTRCTDPSTSSCWSRRAAGRA